MAQQVKHQVLSLQQLGLITAVALVRPKKNVAEMGIDTDKDHHILECQR